MERAVADNSKTHQHHIKRYQYAVGFIKGKRVCSVACGNGYGEHYMATHGEPEKIFAFDVDQGAVDNANQNQAHPLITFATADKLKELVEDGSIDVFVSLETIEHIKDDRGFLDTVWRTLKPGGLLIISTPNKASSFRNLYSVKPPNKFHVREYKKQEFVKLLTDKFTDVQIFGQKPILKRSLTGLWKYLFYKFTGKLNEIEKDDFEIKPFPDDRAFDMAYLLATCRK